MCSSVSILIPPSPSRKRPKGGAQVWFFLGSLVLPTGPGARRPQGVLVGERREIIIGEGPEQMTVLERPWGPTSKP